MEPYLARFMLASSCTVLIQAHVTQVCVYRPPSSNTRRTTLHVMLSDANELYVVAGLA